jgi:transcriptional regulator of acetoin/glycerol metabolism
MDNREIQRAWEKFIENGAAPSSVRGIVAASWERSQGYQIPGVFLPWTRSHPWLGRPS